MFEPEAASRERAQMKSAPKGVAKGVPKVIQQLYNNDPTMVQTCSNSCPNVINKCSKSVPRVVQT
eukprot:6937577-Heterocapsa_arctica.AAC.1